MTPPCILHVDEAIQLCAGQLTHNATPTMQSCYNSRSGHLPHMQPHSAQWHGRPPSRSKRSGWRARDRGLGGGRWGLGSLGCLNRWRQGRRASKRRRGASPAARAKPEQCKRGRALEALSRRGCPAARRRGRGTAWGLRAAGMPARVLVKDGSAGTGGYEGQSQLQHH